MPEDEKRLEPGAVRIEIGKEGNAMYVAANRAACARLADAFARAAEAQPGALEKGSEEAEEFTSYLNESLAPSSKLLLGEFWLEEDLTAPSPSRRGGRTQDAVALVSCALALVAAVAGVAVFIRGLQAVWADVLGR